MFLSPRIPIFVATIKLRHDSNQADYPLYSYPIKLGSNAGGALLGLNLSGVSTKLNLRRYKQISAINLQVIVTLFKTKGQFKTNQRTLIRSWKTHLSACTPLKLFPNLIKCKTCSWNPINSKEGVSRFHTTFCSRTIRSRSNNLLEHRIQEERSK